MKQKLLVVAAVLVMAFGLWWQFKGSNAEDVADQRPTETATLQSEPEGPESTEEQDFFSDQENPDSTNQPDRPTGTVNEESLAPIDEVKRCRPVQEGYGIIMVDWGKVRLPYADQWPTNQPGTPVDCSPETDFGAAVVAAQSLYLESLSPELIPEIAVDTPARQVRIDNHRGKENPRAGAIVCQPLGWDKSSSLIWKIYHQCDGFPLEVTPVRMRRVGDKWLMVYEIDGRIRINEAEPGTEYFPFEGGD